MESLRYKYRRPTHPGKIIREDILPALGITETMFAKQLGMPKKLVAEVVHEQGALTAEMAVRLSQLGEGSAVCWLKMQQAVDLWDLEHGAANKTAIKKLSNGVKRNSRLRTA